MSALSTPPAADGVLRRLDDQFLELITADEELVRMEFDAIVAAGWCAPPPDSPRRRIGGGRRDRDRRPMAVSDDAGPSRASRRSRRTRRARQRSPPATGANQSFSPAWSRSTGTTLVLSGPPT